MAVRWRNRLSTSYEDVVYELSRLLATSPQYRERAPHVLAVLNPQAGVFAHAYRREGALRTLRRRLDGLGDTLRDPDRIMIRVTGYPGHARALTLEGLKSLRGAESTALLSAGGDGTHRDMLSGIVGARADDVPAFRLPAGTGNDAADARTMNEAYVRLQSLSSVRSEAAIETRSATGALHYAFNVASFGLDAVIAHITNRLKRTVLPGNLYTVVADLATVLYVPLMGIPRVSVRVYSEGEQAGTLSGRFVLVAFGAGGYRRYGGGKPILPDERNLCAIRLPPLARRIALKNLLYRGRHLDEPEVSACGCDSLTVESDERLPFQFDGETVWMEREDFPVTVRLLDGAWLRLQSKS